MDNNSPVVQKIERLAINNQLVVYDLILFEVSDPLERKLNEQYNKFGLLKNFLAKHYIQLIFHQKWKWKFLEL